MYCTKYGWNERKCLCEAYRARYVHFTYGILLIDYIEHLYIHSIYVYTFSITYVQTIVLYILAVYLFYRTILGAHNTDAIVTRIVLHAIFTMHIE